MYLIDSVIILAVSAPPANPTVNSMIENIMNVISLISLLIVVSVMSTYTSDAPAPIPDKSRNRPLIEVLSSVISKKSFMLKLNMASIPKKKPRQVSVC